jgi:phenylacetic acid degradation operon negative regulatory protein
MGPKRPSPGGRRRETGGSSARSMLLTVLGEFVLPQQAPVWTGALVSALAEIGVEDKSARQALSRLAAEGLLASQRLGRRVQWQLTPAATDLLVEGTERIYGFGRQTEAWDGRWLVVALSVPESQRQVRHTLRTRLTWAGLGSPLPGVWVTPQVSKQGEVAAVIASLGLKPVSFVGAFGEIGEIGELVAASWHLDEVEALYAQFLTSFAGTAIGSPAEAFASQVRLVGQWRRFPFMDPGLPSELLPKKWPRQAAADLFHRRHDRWHAPAQTYWHDLMAAAHDRA